MYTKEITDLRCKAVNLTSDDVLLQIGALSRLGVNISFKDVEMGLNIVDSNNNLVSIQPDTHLKPLHFYNGKFWNKPQKTPAEIGKCLKDTNTAKLHERILQLEKQLLETKLENESLGRRLIKAYLAIDRLTTI